MSSALLLLSTAAFILAGAAVGARLIRLALRTRQLTDLVIGLALFDLSAISYPLILVGGLGVLPLAGSRWVMSAAGLMIALGWIGVLVFTVRAFRPGVAWARGAAASAIADRKSVV